MSLSPASVSQEPPSFSRRVSLSLKLWWGTDRKGGFSAEVTAHLPYEEREAEAEKLVEFSEKLQTKLAGAYSRSPKP